MNSFAQKSALFYRYLTSKAIGVATLRHCPSTSAGKLVSSSPVKTTSIDRSNYLYCCFQVVSGRFRWFLVLVTTVCESNCALILCTFVIPEFLQLSVKLLCQLSVEFNHVIIPQLSASAKMEFVSLETSDAISNSCLSARLAINIQSAIGKENF
mgnify:CR=1 FL=1